MADDWLIAGAAGLRRFLTDRFGEPPGEAEGVLHVAAVWRPPGEERNVVLRILDDTPQSALDFLLLNLARARADVIVTTGRILREEPAVTHDLQGRPVVVAALRQWRREVLGLGVPPRLVVLTSGRDLDPAHPAFHAEARPLLVCPRASVEETRRRVGDAPIEVVGRDDSGLRATLDWLREEQRARRVSIEAGPSTAAAAYRDPARVEELLLSVLEADDLPAALGAGELPARRELERILGLPRAFTATESSGRWRFEHYRCAIVRARARAT
jgi:riboflavin biosynthesis pyrimidine reductase